MTVAPRLQFCDHNTDHHSFHIVIINTFNKYYNRDTEIAADTEDGRTEDLTIFISSNIISLLLSTIYTDILMILYPLTSLWIITGKHLAHKTHEERMVMMKRMILRRLLSVIIWNQSE